MGRYFFARGEILFICGSILLVPILIPPALQTVIVFEVLSYLQGRVYPPPTSSPGSQNILASYLPSREGLPNLLRPTQEDPPPCMIFSGTSIQVLFYMFCFVFFYLDLFAMYFFFWWKVFQNTGSGYLPSPPTCAPTRRLFLYGARP